MPTEIAAPLWFLRKIEPNGHNGSVTRRVEATDPTGEITLRVLVHRSTALGPHRRVAADMIALDTSTPDAPGRLPIPVGMIVRDTRRAGLDAWTRDGRPLGRHAYTDAALSVLLSDVLNTTDEQPDDEATLWPETLPRWLYADQENTA